MTKPRVDIFTDGACSGNPGPGGWAAIMRAGGHERELSGGDKATTNTRMELTGVIEGLATLKRRCEVELVTDSEYVGKGIRDWMPKWKSQGWQRKEGSRFKPVINLDLWQKLDELVARHKVRVTIVLGHNGHAENEACDRMAVAAYKALKADLRNG